MGLYYGQNLGASLYIITALSVIMYKVLIIKCRQFYNIYLLFMEFGAQVLMGCRLYFDGPSLHNQDTFSLFFFGASMIQIQLIMHSISQNFVFPLISTITQLIIFVYLTWNISMYDYKFSYIIFTICTTYFLHHNLKEKKEIFMFREQQKQWIKILKNGISQKIITIQYNQKQNELTLNIINKNASEKFKIQNEQDFKLFSRRVNLFKKEIDAYEDYDKKQINRESKLYSGKSTKNTALESRIIQFMKNNINIKKKKDSVKLLQSQSIISKTNSEIPQKSKSIDCSSKISVDGIKQAEYYTIIQSEQQKPDVYKIRMSYFLNEGYHQCYIIFDQQSEEDVIKNVIDSKKKIELRFVNVCQQLGENTKSNVLKISVSDKSGGINPESLLQILKDMSFQKYNKNLENFVYQNLGWKISMHNIGLIGPYADFFISPNILNGLKISFYIYTDINVVFQSNNRIVFSNQQFFDDYKRLKSTYYNKDSKQLIKNFSIKHQDYLEEDQLKLPK
ncbi:hypothetical protein ABPG73_006889 [Tetrahymena malaccensis]